MYGADPRQPRKHSGSGKPWRFGRRKILLLATAILGAVFAAAGITAILVTGGRGKVAAPLFAGANTLARIDPGTNRVSVVIDVGNRPSASAVGGRSVWVYNRGASTISEIDTTTNHVRKTTAVSGLPYGCCGAFAGPVLAANASGAWFVSGDISGRASLTYLPAGGGGKRETRPHTHGGCGG